jgi:ABC-type Fe3+-hydroxamate transport system substrate-binding protein
MKKAITDMMGRTVEIQFPPKRIVSLVPSQTELLFDLGLDKEVVGITKFCVHPQIWFRNKKRVGGTKTVSINTVKTLQPDLIIANKEENTKEQIEELAATFPTWVSDIQTIDGGVKMIREVGKLVDRSELAEKIANEISDGFSKLNKVSAPKRVAYFIWRKPWMVAGGDTFISNMIEQIGWTNVLADRSRYPEIKLEELTSLNVDAILLSSEPYPFKDAHIVEIKAALPGVEVQLVDGEMFSWYGSRMRLAAGYLRWLTG